MNMLRGILIKIYTAINKEKTFENVKAASFPGENWRLWSEWRDLNSRLPHPKCGALPTGLHPDIKL